MGKYRPNTFYLITKLFSIKKDYEGVNPIFDYDFSEEVNKFISDTCEDEGLELKSVQFNQQLDADNVLLSAWMEFKTKGTLNDLNDIALAIREQSPYH